MLAPAGRRVVAGDRPVANLVVLLDGRMAGFWRRTAKTDVVVVEAALLEPLDAARTRALEAEAARYGEFLGLEARPQDERRPTARAGSVRGRAAREPQTNTRLTRTT